MPEAEPQDQQVTFTQEEHLAVMEALIGAARDDLLSFLHIIHPQVKGRNYTIGALHEHLANIVTEVLSGDRGPNQTISVPPQHGKSRMLCVRAVAWLIGRFPGLHIGMTGFSGALLADFMKEVISLIENPIYQQVFPDVYPVWGQNTRFAKVFSNGTSVQIRSAGSKLTGRRVDWLIIDDAHAGRKEAESPSSRRNIIQWFYGDCISRISKDAKIFIIGTRWHPEDLIGHLISEESRQRLQDAGQADRIFQVTNLPAICNSEDDPLGREIGDALFPEERPISFLEGQKAMIPSYEWESQYMGRPVAASSGQVDVSKLNYITLDEVPRDTEWVRGWDLALTEKQSSDYTAGALCAMDKEKRFYIIDITKGQLAWARMRARILETSRVDRENNRVFRIGVEGVGGFDAVYQDVKEQLMGDVSVEKKNPPRGGKLLRAQPWINLVEAGKVFIVRAAWNLDFTTELELFPEALHDDQVDAISVAYELLQSKPRLLIA